MGGGGRGGGKNTQEMAPAPCSLLPRLDVNVFFFFFFFSCKTFLTFSQLDLGRGMRQRFFFRNFLAARLGKGREARAREKVYFQDIEFWHLFLLLSSPAQLFVTQYFLGRKKKILLLPSICFFLMLQHRIWERKTLHFFFLARSVNCKVSLPSSPPSTRYGAASFLLPLHQPAVCLLMCVKKRGGAEREGDEKKVLHVLLCQALVLFSKSERRKHAKFGQLFRATFFAFGSGCDERGGEVFRTDCFTSSSSPVARLQRKVEEEGGRKGGKLRKRIFFFRTLFSLSAKM